MMTSWEGIEEIYHTKSVAYSTEKQRKKDQNALKSIFISPKSYAYGGIPYPYNAGISPKNRTISYRFFSSNPCQKDDSV
jgi:hypothetical protein